MSPVESAPVSPSLWRASSTTSARAKASRIQGNRRRTGVRLVRLQGRLAPGRRAPLDLGDDARALGVGHLRPAHDLVEAAAAPMQRRIRIEGAYAIAGLSIRRG
jgi:hypothetical protein